MRLKPALAFRALMIGVVCTTSVGAEVIPVDYKVKGGPTCRMYVVLPKFYNNPNRKKHKFPLMVYLHGAGGLAPDKAQRDGARVFAQPLADKHECLWILPNGPATGPDQHLSYFMDGVTPGLRHGEASVLEAIRLTKRRWRVDPDRVGMWGHSMGGFGAYHITAHHPDLFSGVVAAAGVTDVNRFYSSIARVPGGGGLFFRELIAKIVGGDPLGNDRAVRRICRQHSVVDLAPGFCNVRILAAHGITDILVPFKDHTLPFTSHNRLPESPDNRLSEVRH